MSSSRRRVSYEQFVAMVEFMEANPILAKHRLNNLEARHTCKNLWVQLATTLNSVSNGAHKNSTGWAKYFSDIKSKIKKKNAHVAVSMSNTGEGPADNTKYLTELEVKLLNITAGKEEPYSATSPQPADPNNTLLNYPVDDEEYYEVTEPQSPRFIVIDRKDPVTDLEEQAVLPHQPPTPVTVQAGPQLDHHSQSRTNPTLQRRQRGCSVSAPRQRYRNASTQRRCQCRERRNTPTALELEKKRLEIDIKNSNSFALIAEALSELVDSVPRIGAAIERIACSMERSEK